MRDCALWSQHRGGDVSVIRDTKRLPTAPFEQAVRAGKAGYITQMDAELCGVASMQLGAGREKLGDTLDPAAGIVLVHKTGDRVAEGDVVAYLKSSDRGRFAAAEETFRKALVIGSEKPKLRPLILARIGVDGKVDKYFSE